jgi:3-hydroxyacyl-CoA dehydrogenase
VVSEVNEERDDGIAVLELNRPVANALAPSLRKELETRLTAALADPVVKAIVLKGAGQGFSSGVDITEYERPLEAPWVGDLCEMIEDAPKPVVAALHGSALGAGFELALAAHARVADRSARVALPEVTLGLIPGAGGTQRLSRVTGAQVALEFLLAGRATEAKDARLRRVFERLVDGDPLNEAKTLANEMAVSGNWKRTRDRDPGLTDPEGYQQAVQAVAARIAAADSAERDIVKCVEAAQLLPFDQAIIFERALFDDRIKSQAARASRHAFASERRAGVMPEIAQGQARPVNHIALLGQGALMVELAIQGLDSGQQVTLVTATDPQAKAIIDRVAAIYDAAVNRQRLQPTAKDQRLSRLKSADLASALEQADLVLDDGTLLLPDEAPALRPGTVWASLQGETPDPKRIATVQAAEMHVVLKHSRPAHSTHLVELAVPEATRPDAVATVARSMSTTGRTIVRSGVIPGLLSGNLFFAMFGAGLALCRAGYEPERIDNAAHDLGFRNGPFETADILGLPQVLSRHESLSKARGHNPPKDLEILSARIAAGAKGRAVGKGIYRYENGAPQSDPSLSEWLAAWRQDGQGALPDGTDVKRALHAAFVNEAARLIEDKRVLRAADIDVVAVKGMGFDRRLGGPLLQADFLRVFSLLQAMQHLEALDSAIWTPHAKILDMVKHGEGFFGRVGEHNS